MPFQSLGLDTRILKAIQEAGYTEPTPIQASAIPVVISGTDLIGIAQTGTGKTAAFTLPILSRMAADPQAPRKTRALILAPTRELVSQIEENVRAYAKHLPLKIATIFGGVGEAPQIQALKSGADIIVACPGRLLDLMKRKYGDFSGLKHFVLDEADRMLDMGFIPDIRRIAQALPRQRQTLLFSATLSKEIEELTHEFLHRPKTVQIGKRSNPAESVTQVIYEVSKSEKLALLLHLLKDPQMDMVLVFSRMKHAADKIARKLQQQGVTTAALHSNRSHNQRIRALQDFKSGAVRVLVATDIAARGIDVDGISHVVNFDFPLHAEDYVHRIGRTGRAQAIGDAISFVTSEDYASLRSLEKFIGRGLIRKKAEGVAPLPASESPDFSERERGPRGQRPRGHRPSGPRRGEQKKPAQHSQRTQGQGQPRQQAASDAQAAPAQQRRYSRFRRPH